MSINMAEYKFKLERLLEQSQDRLSPDNGHRTKEVFSNLVLHNASVLNRLLREVLEAKKAVSSSTNPKECKALDNIYAIGAALRSETLYSPTKTKAELEENLTRILDAMVKIEKGITAALKRLQKKLGEGDASANWNETIQLLFASENRAQAEISADQSHIQEPGLPRSPAVWDGEEDNLVAMICCSNQEWALRYEVDAVKRTAFFPSNSSIEQIAEWFENEREEAQDKSGFFKQIAIYNTVGAKVS